MISEILSGGLFKLNDGRDLVSSEIKKILEEEITKEMGLDTIRCYFVAITVVHVLNLNRTLRSQCFSSE